MTLLTPTSDRPIPEGCSLSTPLGAALTPLATMWRETNSDEVARRLVDLSEAFASFFRKLPKKGGLFERLVSNGEPRMLTVLLRSVTHGSEEAATDRLTRIWECYRIDPRTRVYLDRWRARKPRPYPRGLAFDATLDVVRGEWAEDLARITKSKSFRPLTNADRIVLGRADDLIASMPKRQEALRLLRDVYTHPKDIARRIVFSDALMDLGDPWGELIAIQCTRKLGTTSSTRGSASDQARTDARTARREEELLRDNRRTWLGRLSPWVHDDPPATFEAGFPSVISASPMTPTARIREWGTVTNVVEDTPGGRGRPFPYRSRAAQREQPLFNLNVVGRARSLTSAYFIVIPRGGGNDTDGDGNGGDGVIRVPRLRWRNTALQHLTLRLCRSQRDASARFFAEWSRCRAFPNLERLDIETFAEEDIEATIALTDAWRWHRSKLNEIGFTSRLTILLRRIASMLEVARPLPTLHSLSDRASVTFDSARRSLTLSLDAAIDMPSVCAQLATAKLRELRVEASQKAWPSLVTPSWRRGLDDVKLDLVRV